MKFKMKKCLFILSFMCIANIIMAQKIKVVDTIRIEVTCVANQPRLHKMLKKFKKHGGKIISADRKNNNDLYVWKLEAYQKRRVKKK